MKCGCEQCMNQNVLLQFFATWQNFCETAAHCPHSAAIFLLKKKQNCYTFLLQSLKLKLPAFCVQPCPAVWIKFLAGLELAAFRGEKKGGWAFCCAPTWIPLQVFSCCLLGCLIEQPPPTGGGSEVVFHVNCRVDNSDRGGKGQLKDYSGWSIRIPSKARSRVARVIFL